MTNDPFDLFVQQVKKQEKTKKNQQQQATIVVSEKSKKLIPMRKLLKQIADTGLMVHHADRFGDRNTQKPAQRFEVFEDEASPSFAPGPSLYFEHPANVEISIPNEWDENVQGVVCIRCSTPHPESQMLYGPFRSMEAAMQAIAHFLARGAVSMDTRPEQDQ